MKNKKYLFGILIVIVILLILSFALSILTQLTILESLRIFFGSVYVLFLPGFLISYIFFPKTKEFEEKNKGNSKGTIDWIERIALSFALSIAIVPLAVFYLNLIGLKINLINSFFTILGIVIISAAILFYKIKCSRP
jgi:uncharacterized membrane protein